MVSKKILALAFVGALGFNFVVNADGGDIPAPAPTSTEEIVEAPAARPCLARRMCTKCGEGVSALPGIAKAHPAFITLTALCGLVVFAEETNHPFLSWVLANPVEASVKYLGKPSVEFIDWLWVRYNKNIIRNLVITGGAATLAGWAIYAHKNPESKLNLWSDYKNYMGKRKKSAGEDDAPTEAPVKSPAEPVEA